MHVILVGEVAFGISPGAMERQISRVLKPSSATVLTMRDWTALDITSLYFGSSTWTCVAERRSATSGVALPATTASILS